MRSALRAFVTAPTFADDDMTRNARLMYIVIFSTLFLNIVSIVIAVFLNPIRVDLTLNLVTVVIQIFFLFLVRKGYTKHVIVIFSLLSWLVITDAAHTVDGLVNPVVALYVIPILFTGLLVSVQAGVAFTILSLITTIAFVFAAQAGLYPQTAGQIELGTRLANYISLFGFTGVAVYLSVGAIQDALTRVRASEATLRERNLQLQSEIEKRELAQKELTASELRWRFALDGSDTGVWELNLETRDIYRSPRYMELLGYTAGTVQNLQDLTTLIHPEDMLKIEAKRDDYAKHETFTAENEMRILCGDGTYKWFLYRGNTIERKPDGKPLRLAGTLTDINVRKQLEAAQKVSEEGYRTLFENNPNPMYVIEKQSLRFIAVNDAAILLYGYSREAFLQMGLHDIMPSAESKRLEDVIDKPLPILSPPDLWQHCTHEGRVIQVEMTGHETIFQEKVARLVLIRDMTAQKETEESLRTSQELFNNVFENVPVGVAVSHMEDGRYLSVNPHMAAMLEYSREDMIGHTSAELKIMDRSMRGKYIEEFKAHLTSAAKSDFKLRSRSGRTIEVLTSTQAVTFNNEAALLSIVVDVTAVKRAERERLQIEILQSELDKQREMIDLKERFISSVSHEFRSPLTIMLTGTGILKMHDAKFSTEQRKERLAKIETQIHYLSALLDNILTIGKARAGKFEFNPRAMDIVMFCRDLFEDFRLTDNDQHKFIFQTDGDFAHAHMDEKLLQHILMNLISNAMKYSPAGKEIKLTLKRDVEYILIEVSDQGIGIPEEEQDMVFEPFFRSRNAETFKGTGLGLAITKESVDAHGGSINWRSKQGQGTTFSVRLPGGFKSALSA